MQVLSILVIALQYSLVILLYYFLYRVVKIASKDLNKVAFDEPATSLVRYAPDEDSNFADSPRLIVLDDKNALLSQTVFTIDDSLSIGRSQHNDLIINDNFVSHEHACISKSKHNYLLADLNSTNGTILNGQQIEEETALNYGDVIQIGAVTLKFER